MSPDAVAVHDDVMSQVARVADDIGVVTQVAVVADVSVMSDIVARVLRALCFL